MNNVPIRAHVRTGAAFFATVALCAGGLALTGPAAAKPQDTDAAKSGKTTVYDSAKKHPKKPPKPLTFKTKKAGEKAKSGKNAESFMLSPHPGDDPWAAFTASPAGKSQVSPKAHIMQLADASYMPSVNLRLATYGTSVILQRIDQEAGEIQAELDLSDYVDSVTTADVVTDYDTDPNRVLLHVLGSKDGEPVYVRAAAATDTVLGNAKATEVTTLDATGFKEKSGLAIADIDYLAPYATGLAVVVKKGKGFEILRPGYDFSPATRDAVQTSFPAGDNTYKIVGSQVVAIHAGGLDATDMYGEPDVHIAAPGLDEPTAVSTDNILTAADADGDIAAFDLGGGKLGAMYDAGGEVTALTTVYTLGEIQAATSDKSLKRINLDDGSLREDIDLPGAITPGSLRSSAWWNAATTSLVNVDGTTYGYSTTTVSRAEPAIKPSLSTDTRGGQVQFATGASGTNTKTNWEYSLDGGQTWIAKDTWNGAESDSDPAPGGLNVTKQPSEALPDPLDGKAPYLRQEVDPDIWFTSTYMRTDVRSVSDEQYDALWRFKATGDYGTTYSDTTKIDIADEADDAGELRITQQPAAARVTAGEQVDFTAEATAEAEVSVQWQSKTGQGDWTAVEGATEPTLSVDSTRAATGTRYRAVFASGDKKLTSDSAKLEVMPLPQPTLAEAPDGAVAAKDATLKFDLSEYSHQWLRNTAGSHVSFPADDLDNGVFTFSDGAGWEDRDGDGKATGKRQISWSGAAIHRPYGGSYGIYIAIANPTLDIAADGSGVLKADVAWNDSEKWSGDLDSAYKRVTVATFAKVPATQDADARDSAEATVTFSVTPEFSGREYTDRDGTVYDSSFPAEFIDYLGYPIRGWFYASGSGQDSSKAGKPLDVEYTVSSDGEVPTPPTEEPTGEPTGEPTEEPSQEPTGEPTTEPSEAPSDGADEPSSEPTDDSGNGNDSPAPDPSDSPSAGTTPGGSDNGSNDGSDGQDDGDAPQPGGQLPKTGMTLLGLGAGLLLLVTGLGTVLITKRRRG